jgi:1-acyl-sn-glycerol-3-phosphate acyltransferase
MSLIRARFFHGVFVVWTALVSLLTVPVLLGPQKWVLGVQLFWARGVLWLMRHIAGVSHEIRGRERVPEGVKLIASKHQSAWDTIIFLLDRPAPAFVLKKELLKIPVYGWYCIRTGMVPIDRAGGSRALREMIREARARMAVGRPLVIFPEGTRVPPDDHKPLQPGVAGLYRQLNVPVVPVALNSGLVWPKSGFVGTDRRIVLEYLDPIPPGLPKKEFMKRLQTALDEATVRLMAEGRAERAASLSAPADTVENTHVNNGDNSPL